MSEPSGKIKEIIVFIWMYWCMTFPIIQPPWWRFLFILPNVNNNNNDNVIMFLSPSYWLDCRTTETCSFYWCTCMPTIRFYNAQIFKRQLASSLMVLAWGLQFSGRASHDDALKLNARWNHNAKELKEKIDGLKNKSWPLKLGARCGKFILVHILVIHFNKCA